MPAQAYAQTKYQSRWDLSRGFCICIAVRKWITDETQSSLFKSSMPLGRMELDR